MMKKFVFAISMLAALPVTAQETYENANIVTEDLNGTARFVGMGGAMDALGADISTIATNPAGLGLFRSSQVAVTAGMSMQQDAKVQLHSHSGSGHPFSACLAECTVVYQGRG